MTDKELDAMVSARAEIDKMIEILTTTVLDTLDLVIDSPEAIRELGFEGANQLVTELNNALDCLLEVPDFDDKLVNRIITALEQITDVMVEDLEGSDNG